MVKLLESMGAHAEWTDPHSLRLQCKDVDPDRLDQRTITTLRSSALLMGPLVARFPRVVVGRPGGDNIGNRPLDTHFEALKGLGAQYEETMDRLTITRTTLQGAEIILPEFSVTATENIVMAACLANGITTVHIAAMEPHVQNLIQFLQSMGAKIEGSGTHTLRIEGAKRLRGGTARVIPDQIEIGTWAVAAAVTHGDVRIHNVMPEHLHIVLLKLRQAGVRCELESSVLHVTAPDPLRAFRLQTLPYPGFPTDLQAPFSVLATQAEGTSLIHDPLYEGRMGHIGVLVKMGAQAVVCDPHRVLLTGPTQLYGQDITSFDIRAGATLLLAGLTARGTTTIHGVETIDRGYEATAEKVQGLGGMLERRDHEH